MRHCVNEGISVWESEAPELHDALREVADLIEDTGMGVATLYIYREGDDESIIVHGYTNN